MICPFCKSDSRVVDSRMVRSKGNVESVAVRRRRVCMDPDCGKRFTTYERPEVAPRMVVKKDGSRECYSRDKVLRGMMRACEKRRISLEQLNDALDDIEGAVFNDSVFEAPTAEIGEGVSLALRELDQVAFVRFTSVYREFADIGEFEHALRTLRRKESPSGIDPRSS